jgi:hypothetical protein
VSAAPWPRRGVFRANKDGVWFVPSATTEGVYYCIEWGYTGPNGSYWTCTCRAGENRGHMTGVNPCRHVREVAVAEQNDGYEPRPSAPPAPGSSYVE